MGRNRRDSCTPSAAAVFVDLRLDDASCESASVDKLEAWCYIIALKGIPRFHSLMATPHRPSLGVRRSLHKLGQDIRDARRRRGLPAAVIAQRAFTSRPSIRRIEAGDASVSIGIYAAVLQALGLLDGLSQLADPSRDVTGLAIASENLPERVHLRRQRQKRDG